MIDAAFKQTLRSQNLFLIIVIWMPHHACSAGAGMAFRPTYCGADDEFCVGKSHANPCKLCMHGFLRKSGEIFRVRWAVYCAVGSAHCRVQFKFCGGVNFSLVAWSTYSAPRIYRPSSVWLKYKWRVIALNN